ncbi:GNAT family acetyltransferase [Glacieibacterium frigidum]|uniref:GNAT family acetyltransferase n=1 Tax=Glacieibacterium frigidum TaxID=2593303 RepID=A0A552U8X8_9SPHN|nr:GNAT family acetyltransferase [Glacieibacterium frigidum]TRW14671.1 GNAT family acetyltransferase [Glacieibacterium frigidum]
MIATLTEAEIAATVALIAGAGLSRPWNDTAADLRLALAAPSSTVFVAHQGNDLAGCVMTGCDGHRGWVYYLAVADSARGASLGRALMQQAEAWCAAQGVPRLNLMVRADNIAATEFYARLGYRTSDVVVLQRDLTSGSDAAEPHR